MALKVNVATNKLAFYCYDRTTGSPYTGVTTVFSAKVADELGIVASGTGTFAAVDTTNAPGWYTYTTETLSPPLAVGKNTWRPFLLRVLSSNADHRFDPPVHFVYPEPDWDSAIKGAGFNQSTDSLEAIRDALEDAFTPIVRDD